MAVTNRSGATATGVPLGYVILSGGLGAPRGALYAVDAFLEALGVRFFAPDATVVPSGQLSQLSILLAMDLRQRPALEYRQVRFSS